MEIQQTLPLYLKTVKELIYDYYGIELTNVSLGDESIEYGACSFLLNGLKVVCRLSKITPKKEGQFVTLWKRNQKGNTVPLDNSDNFDYIIIISKTDDKLGQFVFSKSILVEKGIVSLNQKGGKRGIRVYPTWEKVSNKQAEKTQNWQMKYFVTMGNDLSTYFDFTI